MATYWENSCSFGLRYVSWYKYLIVSLVFSHLGFWSGNLFRIASFPDLCLLVPFFEQKLSTMDLSCYDKVVLHVGGNDVEAKVSPTEFKRKYQSLLKSVANKKSELFISGLLPRKGLNMKPFNNILKDLSSEVKRNTPAST